MQDLRDAMEYHRRRGRELRREYDSHGVFEMRVEINTHERFVRAIEAALKSTTATAS